MESVSSSGVRRVRARTIRDLERVGRDDAAPAEGARGEALGARLEVGERGRAAFLEPAQREEHISMVSM